MMGHTFHRNESSENRAGASSCLGVSPSTISKCRQGAEVQDAQFARFVEIWIAGISTAASTIYHTRELFWR